ncbi:MAG: acetyl-CoA carboxylase biotin carboxyl carrier protein [Oscillospiraceae bacterium]|nr:acetyl-CoA carboxylase biotin carboxyl carrier protein [Oscillospiraceae bacterium]
MDKREKLFGELDIETIEKLTDMVVSKELSGLEIVSGDKKIVIKGKKCPPPPPPRFEGAAPASAPAEEPKTEENPVAEGNVIRSPIVGTFYSSPSPDKPAFVKKGQRVKRGDVVCIIESMKVMNEIQSEFDGVVDSMPVKNGDMVEYDQPILVIK